MKIGMRLTVGFGVVLMILIGGFAVGIYELYAINSRTEHITQRQVKKTDLLHECERMILDNALCTLQMTAVTNARAREDIVNRILNQPAGFTKHIQDIEELLETAKGRALMAEIKSLRVPYVESFNKARALVDEGKNEEAMKLVNEDTIPKLRPFEAKFKELIDLQMDLMAQSTAEAGRAYSLGKSVLIALGSGGFLLAFGLAFWNTRAITHPLGDVVKVLESVAKGDVSIKANVRSRDEVGLLGESANLMVAVLQDRARLAERVSVGDLKVDVNILSPHDALGIAPMLQSRLMRRLRELQLRSLEDYQRLIFSDEGQHELVHFMDAVTTNKTDFFREPQHFDYLVRTAVPEVHQLHRGIESWRLKVWCAGCSSGEEPYTLAMVLSEYAKQHPGFDFTILATDISTKVLDHAQAGIYDQARIEPIAMPLRHKYLLRSNDPDRRLVRIVPELRSKITFLRLNFMDADYALNDVFDIIFFRNVMIYFDKETQESVLRKQCRHLRSGGFLFVGHSESLAGLNLPLGFVESAIFRKK